VKKALRGIGKNKKLFRKWFGRSTAQSDENVEVRLQRAIKMMYDPDKIWKVLCCKNSSGACKGCKERTLAYVTKWFGGSTP